MPQLIEPRCPYFGTCGGCSLQHIPYGEQLEMKRMDVRDNMEKQGVTGVEIYPTLGMKEPWFYRNKIQFPIRSQNGQLQMGYFKKQTHEVVNIKECYIQNPFLTEIAQIACKIFEERELTAYDEQTGKGLLRHFIGRSGFQSNELLLGIVVNAKGLPAGFTVANEIKKQERLMHRQVTRHADYPEFPEKPRIAGIIQNSNIRRDNVILGEFDTKLFGSAFMKDRLGNYQFKVHLQSFYQVNPSQAIRLYNLIVKLADLHDSELVVDAYAGIGPIAIWLAKKADKVIGIEPVAAAVKDAKENIRLNKLANVEMLLGRVEDSLPKNADVIVLDPPRAGCSDKAIKAVVRAKPGKIIYVSCNPQTLARDIKILMDYGFKADFLQPLDMFPQTEH